VLETEINKENITVQTSTVKAKL